MKKFLSFFLSLSMIFTFTVPAMAADNIMDMEISSETLNQYLIDAGYPVDFIQAIDTTVKEHLYKGQYSYESSNEVYGILTEDYNIEYSLDENGVIDIDAENSNEFIQLLNDSETIEKILLSQNSEASINRDSRANVLQSKISKVKNMSQDAALLTLSNWSASITCSHKSYTNGVAKKYLTYSWKWSYSPVWSLTDKVAMAWSGGFTAEPETIYWTYKKNVGFTGSQVTTDYINESGYGYDDYDCNAGCAKGINIRGTFAGTYDRYHAGTLSAEVTKATNSNSRESAIGRYYHKKVFPGLSLAFSKTGPSISVSAGSNYDQSADSAVAFWATSK